MIVLNNQSSTRLQKVFKKGSTVNQTTKLFWQNRFQFDRTLKNTSWDALVSGRNSIPRDTPFSRPLTDAPQFEKIISRLQAHKEVQSEDCLNWRWSNNLNLVVRKIIRLQVLKNLNYKYSFKSTVTRLFRAIKFKHLVVKYSTQL